LVATLEHVLKITHKLEVYEDRADVELAAHCLASKVKNVFAAVSKVSMIPPQQHQ
jgi:hypothetical protein